MAGSKVDSKNPRYINSRAGDIEVPVIHEKTIQDEKAKKRLSLPNDYWNGYVPKAFEVPGTKKINTNLMYSTLYFGSC